MRFLDLFAGVGTAHLAFTPLGWQCAAFAETDKFKVRVLKKRFPDVSNFGDITKFRDWPDERIDLVAGGSPCQSFSLAGLRRGLADPRGGLMLSYLGVVARYRPRWVVWENVPGVLSQGGGLPFASFLQGLDELGYSCAWRVLDAQHIRTRRHPSAVAQARRRLFLIGYSGHFRNPASVLFEPESMRGDRPPIRETRAFDTRSFPGGLEVAAGTVSATVTAKWEKRSGGPAGDELQNIIAERRQGGDWMLRRLTPRECERLQGMPDDFTAVPYRKNPSGPDNCRYRAIGDAWAVNCAEWIGERIDIIERGMAA
jgi:site-specific DNA-cytosine methylase